MGLFALLCPFYGDSFFYFFFGCSVALYFMILFTSKKRTVLAGPVKPFASLAAAIKDQSPIPQKRLYMNVFFLDRKEFIRNIIRSKVSRNRPVVRALAKRAAVVLLENGIVEKVGKVICQTVPERLSFLGISSTCTIAYTQKAYICFEINMFSLDVEKMIASAGTPEKAKSIMGFFDRFLIPAIHDYVARFLLNMVGDKLVLNLPAIVREKMYNRVGAEMEIIVCTEEDQGPFLVQTIQHIEASEALQKAPPSSSAESSPAAPAMQKS